MLDWVKIIKERLDKKIKSYKANNHTETIEIPLYDFFVMLESLETVCSEYCGAREIDEVMCPVYEKYMDINKEE